MSTTKQNTSLRRSLVVRTGCLFLVLLLLLALGINYYTRSFANLSFDKLLTGASFSMTEAIYVDGESVYIDLPYAAFEIMQLAPLDKVYYKIVDHNGDFVTGYEDLPEQGNLIPSNDIFFYEATYKCEVIRGIVRYRFVSEPEVNGWVKVILAHGIHGRKELHFELLTRSVVAVIIVMLIAMVVVWQVINSTLKPLRFISGSLTKHKLNDPLPLIGDNIKEIAPLVDRINDYHKRMHSDYELMKNYIADASHQIRTGLSTIQVSLDITDETNDKDVLLERLQTIRNQHKKLTRLAGQILSHAMIIHRRDQSIRAMTDMNEELKSIITDVVRDNAHTGLTFSFNSNCQIECIYVDRVSVREAVRNLIDNAIRYGPSNNQIEISLFNNEEGMLAIVVDDSGPGIPSHLRRLALQRFSRLSKTDEGSGLGLAIANSVAKAHGGCLLLGDSPLGGLRVGLYLSRNFGRADV